MSVFIILLPLFQEGLWGHQEPVDEVGWITMILSSSFPLLVLCLVSLPSVCPPPFLTLSWFLPAQFCLITGAYSLCLMPPVCLQISARTSCLMFLDLDLHFPCFPALQFFSSFSWVSILDFFMAYFCLSAYRTATVYQTNLSKPQIPVLSHVFWSSFIGIVPEQKQVSLSV